MNRFCQSCGMPMKKDPEGGGTEIDGSRSLDYCSFCYRDGAFCAPEIDSAEKMQQFCIEKLKGQGVPRPVGWLLTRNIPGLKRWRSADS